MHSTHTLIKGYGELGSHIWDAGIVLSRFLETDVVDAPSSSKKIPFCSGKKCIELGSGIGLTGTVAALVCAHIHESNSKGNE